MYRTIISTIAVVLAIGVSSDVDAAAKWGKHGSKKGVVVFTAAHPASDVPQVKAVTVVDASPAEVWKFITGPRMKMAGLKDRRVLGSCGQNCDYVYVRLGNMLIDDRHYVVQMKSIKKEVNGQVAYSRLWSKTSQKRPPGKAAPVNSIRGSWDLIPVDGGKKTRVTYRNHLDLGGSVPAALYSVGFVNKAYEILGKVKGGV